MAESYSVKAILSATDKGFTSTMEKAHSTATSLGSKIKSGLGFGALMAVGSKAVSTLSSGLSEMAKGALDAGMSFESAMSSVAAISGSTGKDLQALKNKAKEMGATTQFSATEAGNAMEYMAMAGWKSADMINGIGGIMNLAAASGADLATTSDIVTDALTAFGQSASDSGRFADVMAAASSNANTNVEMMGETFKYVGAAAGAMGYTIEDMAVATGLMANSGIKGTQAGTALRSTITRLAKPTKESEMAMKALGLSITDSNGDMKSFGTIMQDMRKGFKNMTADQKASTAAMLGGQEAMSGLLAIANASDDDFNKLTGAINGSTGAAEDMAKVKLDNLKGDATILKSGMESLGITIFDQVGGNLRGLVGTATEVVSEINSLISDKNIIGNFLADAEKYWTPFSEAAGKAGKAIWKVASVVMEFASNILTNEAVVKGFTDIMSSVGDVFEFVGNLISDNSDIIQTATTWVAGFFLAWKGYKKISSAVSALQKFGDKLMGVTNTASSGLANKLDKIAGSQTKVGSAAKATAKDMLASAKSFMMMGAGILMVAGGFALLAFSAIQLAKAGPLAIGVMAGLVVGLAGIGAGMGLLLKKLAPMSGKLIPVATAMLAMGAAVILVATGFAILTASAIALANAGPLAIGVMAGLVLAVAGLAAGAAFLGPALTAGAVGFIAFGAAIVLVGVGALLAAGALTLIANVLPTLVEYGLFGSISIAALGASMFVLGVGALVAGAGALVLGAGLILVGVGALGAAVGVLALAVATIALGAGLNLCAVGAVVLGPALLTLSVGSLAAGASLLVLTAAVLAFTASGIASLAGTLALTAGMVAFGASLLVVTAGMIALAAGLVAVLGSMKSISSSAKSTEKSLKSMKSSISFVNSALDGLGSLAKSAVNSLISKFKDAEGKVKSAGKNIGDGVSNGVENGTKKMVVVAISATAQTVSAFAAGQASAYAAGVFIGQGLANGMRSQVGYVSSVASQLAAAAEKAIRLKAQIHSPSKVADKLGAYFGDGFGNGILDKVAYVKKASEKLFSIPEIYNPKMAFSGINGTLSDEYSYTQSAEFNINIPFDIDGKEFAHATGHYTQEELEKMEKFKNYLKGVK